MQDGQPQRKKNTGKNDVPATKADSRPNTSYPDLWGASAQIPRHAHRERVFNLAFDASGNDWMASASEANEVKLWNVASTGIAPILSTTLSHKAEVLRVAWGQHQGKGADGVPKDHQSSWLATGSAAGGVRVYFVSSEQGSDEDEEGNSCEAASASTTATLVTEFDHPEEGQQIYALQWMDNDIDERDAKRLLLTAADDKVFFWDLETQSVTTKWSFEQLPPEQDKEESSSTVYGGTNRNPGGMCYVFDATVGRLYPGQSSDVVCLALSDGSVRVLDRRAGEAVATVRGVNGSHLTALCLSAEEGILLACEGKGNVVAYDTRTFSVRAVLEGCGRPVFGAAVVPRGLAKEHVLTERRKEVPIVMTWSTDTCLRFYELGVDNAMMRHVVQHQNFPIYTAAFSPGQGRRLVLGGGMGMPEPHNSHLLVHKGEKRREGGGEEEGGGVTSCSRGAEDEHHHHPPHHHNNAGETVVPSSLLSYQFSK